MECALECEWADGAQTTLTGTANTDVDSLRDLLDEIMGTEVVELRCTPLSARGMAQTRSASTRACPTATIFDEEMAIGEDEHSAAPPSTSLLPPPRLPDLVSPTPPPSPSPPSPPSPPPMTLPPPWTRRTLPPLRAQPQPVTLLWHPHRRPQNRRPSRRCSSHRQCL